VNWDVEALAAVTYLEVECCLAVNDQRGTARLLDGLLRDGLDAVHDRILDEVRRRRGLPDWRSYE
jgi:hypothetical protein